MSVTPTPGERARLIAQFEREESRHFRDADKLKEAAKRAETAGFIAQSRTLDLKRQERDEEIARQALEPILDIVWDFVSDHDNGLGPDIDRLRAVLQAAGTGERAA